MSINNTIFEEIIPDNDQIITLYDLLNRRTHRISHNNLPSFDEHKLFVDNHPYRAWYLVNFRAMAIGSFYISKDNAIAINLVDKESVDLISKIIMFVCDKYTPLKPIPSVRSGMFAINVAPSNEFLLDAMNEIGAKVAQTTFFIP
jgi:hypothetical protein